MVAAFTTTVNDFFVRQNSSQGRTPVDECIGLECETVFVSVFANGRLALIADFGRYGQFGNGPSLPLLHIEPGVEHHQHNPLRPTEVIDIGR